MRKRARQLDSCLGVEFAVATNLRANCIHIRLKSRRRHHPRMEVAIRALRLTKRHLNVDTQGGHAKILAQGLAAACPRRRRSICRNGACSARSLRLPVIAPRLLTPPSPSPKPSAPAAHQTRTKKSPAKSLAPASRPPQKLLGSSPSSPSSRANPYCPPHGDTARCAVPVDRKSPPNPTPHPDRHAR